MRTTFKERLSKIKYTLKHWYYYQKIAFKLKAWNVTHLLHDLDKVFLYLYCNDISDVQAIHRKNTSHHIEGRRIDELTPNRIINAIIDWECARFSKKDKPLNARQTLSRFYSSYASTIEPYLKSLNL